MAGGSASGLTAERKRAARQSTDEPGWQPASQHIAEYRVSMRPHRDHEGRWTLRPVICGLVVAIVIVVTVLMVGVLRGRCGMSGVAWASGRHMPRTADNAKIGARGTATGQRQGHVLA